MKVNENELRRVCPAAHYSPLLAGAVKSASGSQVRALGDRLSSSFSGARCCISGVAIAETATRRQGRMVTRDFMLVSMMVA